MPSTSNASSEAQKYVEFAEYLEANRRFPARFKMHNGLVIGFTHHALGRCTERKIDPMELLRELRGVKFEDYIHYGVHARYRPWSNHLTIITVYSTVARREAALLSRRNKEAPNGPKQENEHRAEACEELSGVQSQAP